MGRHLGLISGAPQSRPPGPARWPGSRKEIRSSSASSTCVRPPRRASENGWCVPPPGSSKNSMLSRMFRTMCSMLLCPTSRCICCLILERATCGLEAKEGAVLVSAFPRRDFEDRLPVFRNLAKHPDRRCLQLMPFFRVFTDLSTSDQKGSPTGHLLSPEVPCRS